MPEERIEVIDGKEFKVVVLPPAPIKSSRKTRWKMADVGKAGSLAREREQEKKRE